MQKESCSSRQIMRNGLDNDGGIQRVTWWLANNLRLIQNNLREVDADLDVSALMERLERFGANTLMMNAGGIFAFYPSKLEYQYVTPYLKKDLLGEAVAAAHKRGMRFIARFDFSKAHESVFARRPEWFYRTAAGDAVNFGGIVHTCVNSFYQREYSKRMMEEVLTQYPVDGVFFNMFGYQTKDYSGKDYGLCYCDNCRERFRSMYGLELPERADGDAEASAAYRAFRNETVRETLDDIHAFVKQRWPHVAISTYHHHKVDIVRNESNTALSRPHPVWLYSASENVMSVENSWENKVISNCSINAIDLQHRFTSVSPHETAIRLYESIASGSGLDFCIIGAFEDYTDRTNYETVREAFHFHREHEQLLGGGLTPRVNAALVRPHGTDVKAKQEYYGVFKMLKERHIPFAVIDQNALAQRPPALLAAQAVILPGLSAVDDACADVLAGLRDAGTAVVATGAALRQSPEALRSLFGASCEQLLTDTDAAYVQVDDRELFVGLPQRDWVVVAGDAFASMRFEQPVEGKLPLVAPSSYGPPERAYGHRLSDYWGLGIIGDGATGGRMYYYAWSIGALYYKHGFEDHMLCLTDVLERVIADRRCLRTDAPACVELSLHERTDGSLLLQAINLSGFNGVTYRAPLPIGPIRVWLRTDRQPSDIRLLKADKQLSGSFDGNGWLALELEGLDVYEAVSVNY